MKKGRLFRRGDFVEISRNINAIPAGIYQLIQCGRRSFLFTVEEQALIEISSEGAHCFKRLEPDDGYERRMRFDEFEEQYYVLLKNLRKMPPDKVRTACIFLNFPPPESPNPDLLH